MSVNERNVDLTGIIGNTQAQQYLQQMVRSGRIGHSLLFSGCDGVGKGLCALALARVILCENDPDGRHALKLSRGVHPDLHIYRPEGKIAMHSMETMRALTEQVYCYPSEAAKQVLIIHDAERMLATSANALLKTFEEPAPQAVMILLSSNPQALLPTVRSRCRTLRFQPVSETEIANWLMTTQQCAPEHAPGIAVQAKGSVGKALQLFRSGDSSQRAAILQLLAAGRVATYRALTESIQPICETLDQLKEELDAGLRKAVSAAELKEMPAAQREAFQKEIDGAVTLRWREEVQALLTDVLDWYRDLHVLQTGAEQRHLLHRGYAPQLAVALARGDSKPIEQVERAVQAVKVSIERSTPLKTCLESLLLTLGFLDQ